jgi:hypothetical protein
MGMGPSPSSILPSCHTGHWTPGVQLTGISLYRPKAKGRKVPVEERTRLSEARIAALSQPTTNCLTTILAHNGGNAAAAIARHVAAAQAVILAIDKFQS